MRLQLKTIVTFLFVALLPVLLTGGVAYTIAKNAIENSLGNGFLQIANETINKVDRNIFEVYQNIHAWSRLDIMQDLITDDLDGNISTYLKGLEREYGYFSSIFALNANGKVVAASDHKFIGFDMGKEQLYRDAIGGSIHVEDIHFDELSKEQTLTFSFPIKAKFLDNKIIGVLCAMWRADELLKLTQPVSSSEDRANSNPSTFVIRRDGLIISAPKSYAGHLFSDNMVKLGLKSASLATHTSEGYLVELTPFLGESLLGFSYSKGYRDFAGLNWAVLVAQDTRSAFLPIRHLNLAILVIGAVVTLLVIFMSLVISRKMTTPILGIAHAARRVSEGDLSSRADHTSRDEIGSLANTFNRMVQDLRKQRDQLVEKHYVDSIITNMTNSLIVVDLQGVIKTINQATLDLLGYREEEVIGQPAEAIFQQAPLKGHWLEQLLDGNTINNAETTYTSKAGTGIPVLLSASAMQNERGEAQGIVCVAQDLTERMKAEETLAEQAIRDSLTGLYNRRYFDLRIKIELARAERNKHCLAILLCDLDKFKLINDTCGHQVGDEGLKLVSKCILNSVRGIDLVFRWGGDEIMIVLPETTREGARTTADRIRKRIRDMRKEIHPELDISTGIALYPEHAANEDDLIRVADLALYISKKGGDKIHLGAEEYVLDQTSTKVTFQPLVAIQPIVDSRSGQIIGHEALTRDPSHKASPFELFKRYEIIGKLNELKCICFQTQLRVAREANLSCVFINVDFGVLTTVEPLPKPDSLEVILEISELEALHDIETRLEIADTWRKLGYKFAIDDFGAGFISLPFVARLIPEYIKIDRSTILQAVSTPQFKEFMSGMVVALQSYARYGIIVEGIETEKELEIAHEIGIYLVQGYLFGKPYEIT